MESSATQWRKGYTVHEKFGEIREVYMNTQLQVVEVVTSSNEFHITGFLNIFWCEHLEPDTYENKEFILDDGQNKRLPYAPGKLFDNAKSIDCKHKFRYFPNEGVICLTYIIATAVLQENFELSDFPMDRQSMHMYIFGRGPNLGWCWLVDPPDWLPKNAVPAQENPLIITWSSAITEYTYYPGLIDYTGQKSEFGIITLRVQRKTFFYFLHAIFPLFVIVAASFSFACIEYGEVGDRLAIITTLMLASIAFDIVLSGNTPKVSYPTRLDFYMLFGYVIMGALILDVVIVSTIEDEAKKEYFEHMFCTIAGLIWLVTTIAFSVAISVPVFRTSWDKVAGRETHKDIKIKEDRSGCAGTSRCRRPAGTDQGATVATPLLQNS